MKARIVIVLVSVLAGMIFCGCSSKSPPQPGAPFPPSTGQLAGINGVVLTSTHLGELGSPEGFIGVGVPLEPVNPAESGFNKSVTFWVVFSGVNRPNGKTPHLLPNYIEGAENNRPASHYDPIPMVPVIQDNVLGADVWEVTVDTFPVDGSFIFAIALDVNFADLSKSEFFQGPEFDSSYHETDPSDATRPRGFNLKLDRRDLLDLNDDRVVFARPQTP